MAICRDFLRRPTRPPFCCNPYATHAFTSKARKRRKTSVSRSRLRGRARLTLDVHAGARRFRNFPLGEEPGQVPPQEQAVRNPPPRSRTQPRTRTRRPSRCLRSSERRSGHDRSGRTAPPPSNPGSGSAGRTRSHARSAPATRRNAGPPPHLIVRPDQAARDAAHGLLAVAPHRLRVRSMSRAPSKTRAGGAAMRVEMQTTGMFAVSRSTGVL
jgi:hypothetical protein